MIYISEHAIARYRERVKPALDFDPAKGELEALVAMAGEVKTGQPDWFHLDDASPGEGWLELADGIAGLVVGGVITTVVIRGSSHPAHRAYKNQKKAKQRRRRKKPLFKPGMGREKAGTIWR